MINREFLRFQDTEADIKYQLSAEREEESNVII